MENESVVAQGAGVPPAFAQALFTVQQAAAYLGASPWAVRRLIWAGALPYVQVGKRYNVPREALDTWRKENERRNGQPRKRA